jgi:[ribosomal protein S5]-alanine N-acetyltransferase
VDDTEPPAQESAGPVLETPHLLLVPARASDAPFLARHWGDADVRRWLWDGRAPAVSDIAAILDASRSTFARSGYGLWLLRPRTGPEPWGTCGLRRLPPRDDVELIYSLDPRRWGHGYATEAAAAVLAHAFDRLRLERVFAGVDRPNVGSARVLAKLGMRSIGTISQDGSLVPFYLVTRMQYRAAASEDG